jgi:AcrR family transcriptional regulator
VSESTAAPTRDRLLASGAALIGEQGYDGVSVREICKHAATSMNMIHHYFGSKDGLLNEILEQFGADVFALPMRLLDKEPRSRDDFISRMEMLFEATLEAYIERRAVLVVVIREQAELSALSGFGERFTEFLEQAKKKGFVRQEIDSEMVTGAMLDRVLNQVLFAPWMKRSFGIDVLSDAAYKQRWCRANLDLFLRGFVP